VRLRKTQRDDAVNICTPRCVELGSELGVAVTLEAVDSLTGETIQGSSVVTCARRQKSLVQDVKRGAVRTTKQPRYVIAGKTGEKSWAYVGLFLSHHPSWRRQQTPAKSLRRQSVQAWNVVSTAPVSEIGVLCKSHVNAVQNEMSMRKKVATRERRASPLPPIRRFSDAFVRNISSSRV
jgi:hypothetical protein